MMRQHYVSVMYVEAKSTITNILARVFVITVDKLDGFLAIPLAIKTARERWLFAVTALKYRNQQESSLITFKDVLSAIHPLYLWKYDVAPRQRTTIRITAIIGRIGNRSIMGKHCCVSVRMWPWGLGVPPLTLDTGNGMTHSQVIRQDVRKLDTGRPSCGSINLYMNH